MVIHRIDTETKLDECIIFYMNKLRIGLIPCTTALIMNTESTK